MIHRHRRTDNFVVMDTHCQRNTALSLQAKGMHAYLMQLPPDWQISIEGLTKTCTDGRTAIASALNELLAAGYVLRFRRPAALGRFNGYDYHVFEQPEYATEYRKTTVSRFSDYGESENGFSVIGKPATSNNDTKVSINKVNVSVEGANEKSGFEPSTPTVEEAPPVPPPPPAESKVPTLEESVELAMRWVQENAGTLQFWYETARISGWTTADLKSQIATYFSHYRRETTELHRVYREPLKFFTEGFFGWLNNPLRKQQSNRPTYRQGVHNGRAAPVTSDYNNPNLSFRQKK